jgi:hypothetical protein
MSAATKFTDADELLNEQLNSACRDIDARADALEIIIAWRDELAVRIRRRQLLFELVDCGVGLDPVDYDAEIERLKTEVGDFVRVCRALAWRAA